MSDDTKAKPIPPIQSAVLNIGTAASDCQCAINEWTNGHWDDCILWVDCAIAQLESARAKILRHKTNQTK